MTDRTKKASEVESEAKESSTSSMKEDPMPIVNDTTGVTFEAALSEWCAAVRKVHDDAVRPVTEDDPRRVEIGLKADAEGWNFDDFRAAKWTPERLAELYWDECVVLPVFPVVRPSWAAGTDVSTAFYPEVTVTHTRAVWEASEPYVQIQEIWAVDVDDESYEKAEPAFYTDGNGTMAPEQTIEFAAKMTSAVLLLKAEAAL